MRMAWRKTGSAALDISLLDWNRFLAVDAEAEREGEDSWVAFDMDDKLLVSPAEVGVSLDGTESVVAEGSELYGVLRDALPPDVRRCADEPLANLFWDWLEDIDEDVPYEPADGEPALGRLFDIPHWRERPSGGGSGGDMAGREVKLGPDTAERLSRLWDAVDPAALEAAAEEALQGHDWSGTFRSAEALVDYLCDWGDLLTAAADRGWCVWIDNH